MSRFARRVDDNHTEIVKALKAAGAWVYSTAPLGKGFPDLLVAFRKQLFLLEVKDGRKPPSDRKLTPAEQTFIDGCPVTVAVVLCAEDALAAIGLRGRAA